MKDIKIIEVKSEIGAGTRGASLGVEAMKIASLDLNSDFFKKYESIEVENVNELLFDGAKHSYAKFIDGVMIMEERVALEEHQSHPMQDTRATGRAKTQNSKTSCARDDVNSCAGDERCCTR